MPDIKSVAESFRVAGNFLEAAPYGSGHINDTFAVSFRERERNVRYILQRINTAVLQEPEKLMENIDRVCRHAQERLKQEGDADATRRALSLIPTRDGGLVQRDPDGAYWRGYLFIEGARSHDVVQSVHQAEEAARAFGAFQRLLSGLPGGPLHETIPNFHNTPQRFERLMEVMRQDCSGRTGQVAEELQFVEARARDTAEIVDLLVAGELPERITHNDTKLNNVLIDDRSGEGVCVIDLDTVMQGSALYDFGDLVRTATNPAAEDERDLSRVCLRLDMFEALVRGYMKGTETMLTDLEIKLLPFAGKLLALENGIRFLTDHLEGDVYFKIHRKGHNLDRCRTQFALVRSIERQMTEMRLIVQSIAPRH
jgi:Ser/Thr protein kinase RdoA (MazF antagonist)